MSLMARCLIGLLLLGMLFACGVALLDGGIYGLTVFVIHPMALGALTCWVLRLERASSARWSGAGAVLVAACLLFCFRKRRDVVHRDELAPDLAARRSGRMAVP
jgi:hypothetical protein